MTDFRATPEQWETMKDSAADNFDDGYAACILELRARVEALECKYETQRLATLEWGKDVENLQRWSDQHLMRIERLEGTRDPASKVYKINEPLKLTPEQQEEVAALLRPNYPAKPDSSPAPTSPLVERVQRAVHDVEFPHGDDEARAALAQPEPEGPTDDELFELSLKTKLIGSIAVAAACHPEKVDPRDACAPAHTATLDFARAVLARWGRPATELEAKSKPIPKDRQIRSALVERVHSCIVGEPECGHMQARAVIREVANWIKDQGCYPIADAWMAQRLEQEADRG